MKKKITRREALRLTALTTTAFLAACQRGLRETPTASPVVPPAQTATNIPDPTATNLPEPTATNLPEATATAQPAALQETQPPAAAITATVLMTTSITADGLLKIYKALGRKANGNVAVKISSGEPGGHHFLAPDLIAPLVKAVNGTIVECNTAYGGGRADSASHLKVMEAHGFSAIAPVDVMDADGTMNIPISGGGHISRKMWSVRISPTMILSSTWRTSKAMRWLGLAA